MRKLISCTIAVLVGCFTQHANGQCSYSINANTTCLPATLSLNSSSSVSKISWKKNNVEVQATQMKWKEYGTIIFDTTDASDMFVDNSGNVYLCYSTSDVVVKWSVGYTGYQVVAGGNGSGSAANQLKNPVAIHVDASGNIYVADKGNYRIQKWAPGAASGTTVAGGNGTGSNNNQFSYIQDLWVTGNGTVYVADASRVMKWTAGAATGTLVISNVNVTFIAVDASGSVYFCAPPAIYKVTSTTTYTQVVFESDLYNFSLDANNNIFYIKGTSIKRLLAGLTGAANATVVAGSPTVAGTNTNQFQAVVDVSLDAFGHLYAKDYGRLMRFDVNTDTTYSATTAGTYTATVTTVSGCSSTTGSQVIGATAGPTITLSNADTVCAGTSVLFTANFTNGGSGPGFQWKKNGVTVAFGSNLDTYTTSNLANGDKINCSITNTNTGCGAKDSSFITVNPSLNGGTLTSTGNCLPSALLLNDASPSAIIWKNNNTPVDTTEVSWSNIATVVAGVNGTGAALNQFNSPGDIGFDGNGNMYVLDVQNYRVLKFAPGSATGVVVAGGNGNGTAANQLSSPKGMYVTANGTLYVTEAARIRRWLPGSSEGINTITNPSFSSTVNGNSIFVDGSGNVYYTASAIAYKVSADGMNRTVVAGTGTAGSGLNQLNGAWGLFVDDQENVYIADGSNNRIVKWSKGAATGVKVAGLTFGGSAANQLSSPTHIRVDAAGNMYILDFGNKRIQRWAPGANTGTTIITGFNSGRGFAFDNNNDFYLAEFVGSKVTRYPASGGNSIVANTGGLYSVSLYGMNTGCYTATTTISLNSSQGPSVKLDAAAVCKGNPVTVNATMLNEGTNATLQWKKNGGNVATGGNTYTDADAALTDVYGLLVTNTGNGCYQSDSIITPLKPLPEISLSSTIGLPATVTLNSNMVLPTIAWSWNGNVVDTNHNWKTTPVTAAQNIAGGVYGMAIDKAGNIYTGKPSVGILKWTDSTNSSVVMNTPSGYNLYGSLALDKDEYVYATFLKNVANPPTIVMKANPNIGSASAVTIIRADTVGSEANQLNGGLGIAVDDSGYVYISDYGNYRIQKWMPGQPAAITVAGGNGPGSTRSHIASWYVGLDKERNIYARGGTNELLKFSPGSASGTVVAYNVGIGGNYQQHVNSLGHAFLPLGNDIKYFPPGNSNGRTIVSSPDGFFGACTDVAGNLYTYGSSTNGKVTKYTLDSSKAQVVNNAGLYKIQATAFNGCEVTDSIRVFGGSYTFNGGGSGWSDPANWTNNSIPPPVVPEGYFVYINPAGTECVLNGNLTLKKDALLKVAEGKAFKVTGNLIIEQ